MDLLKQYILDKGRKIGRQEASKHRVATDEHRGPEPEDVDLGSIRTDRVHQRMFGQLLRKMHPAEAAGIYDRMHQGTLTDDDKTRHEATQNQFPHEVSNRRKLAVTMENHITIDGIEAFADVAPSSFGYYADLLKDRNRTVALLRDYFADLAFNDEPRAAAVVGVFKKMQELEKTGEYKTALAQASKLAERGFRPEEFSVLEEGSLTPKEAREHAEAQKNAQRISAVGMRRTSEFDGSFGVTDLRGTLALAVRRRRLREKKMRQSSRLTGRRRRILSKKEYRGERREWGACSIFYC